MLEWADYAADAVDALANQDESYLELLQSRNALRQEYEAILAELLPSQREVILNHEYYSLEMEYQKSRLAYVFGKMRSSS